jgi:glyoxalase family protein
MQLGGIHHLTAISADISANHAFYTGALGMRLVKKSVNQDDVSAYHLFYADGAASPGTDLTFFDFPVPRERRGTRSIARTGLRVAGEPGIRWWASRLDAAGVAHGPPAERDGRGVLDFEDFEGQRLSLVADDPGAAAHPWSGSTVPAEFQIIGLGPVTISVPALGPTDALLTGVMGMRKARTYADPGQSSPVTVYSMGPGGPGAELHVAVEPAAPAARQGAGGAHHIAFRITGDGEYEAWERRLKEARIPSSGPVDRYYFRSLYFREPNGILFELATDGPGFAVDEPMEKLGERLALPPFLEHRRREIEAGLKPLGHKA